LTSALHALYGADTSVLYTPGTLNENDWGKESEETVNLDAISEPLMMYYASQSLAEKRFWEHAERNPQVDFTSIVPTMVYGGWIPGYPDETKLVGSSRFMYSLITGELGEGPNTCHVSQQINAFDVAKAHLKAIEMPPIEGKRKRFVISQGSFTYVQGIQLLKKERPELISRLPDKNDPCGKLQSTKEFDCSFAEEVLGMRRADYISAEKTLLDTIDQLVTWEGRMKQL